MRIAQAIVHRLLEEERTCTTCQGELGVKGTTGQSHGYCKRHALAMQQTLLKNAVATGKERLIKMAQDRMAEIQATPEDHYPPDLSKR